MISTMAATAMPTMIADALSRPASRCSGGRSGLWRRRMAMARTSMTSSQIVPQTTVKTQSSQSSRLEAGPPGCRTDCHCAQPGQSQLDSQVRNPCIAITDWVARSDPPRREHDFPMAVTASHHFGWARRSCRTRRRWCGRSRSTARFVPW